MTPTRSLMLAAAALAWAGCVPQAQSQLPLLGPQTWIDAPLDGSVLPPEPYPVIAHAWHPDGIKSLELLVNGSPLAVVPPSPGAEDGTLVHGSWLWDVPGAGSFDLEVRAVSSDGASGPSAFAHVTVRGEGPAPSATATPGATQTSTPTPEHGFGPLAFSSGVFYYGGCDPRQLTIDVTWTGPDGSQPNVVLFFRLVEAEGEARTDWSAEAMNPLGHGVFRRTLASSAIPDYDAFSAALLQVQLVATDGQGNVIGRSDVLSGPGLSRCGITLPPIFLITPTATQELPA